MAWLAVSYPGLSYGHSHPALRLARLALQQLGATVLEVTYPVLAEWDGSDSFWTDARERRFFGDVDDHLAGALGSHQPERVTIVSKSIGSQAVAHLLRGDRLPPETELIWLTPLWKEPAVLAAAREAAGRSLYVVGLADQSHDPDLHRQVVEATGGETLELAGAGHALEVEGDVLATADALRQIAGAVLRFSG